MPWKTLIAVEAVALPIGLTVLDVWRAILLAILVSISLLVLTWTTRISRDYSRQQASQRMAFKQLQRSIDEAPAAKREKVAEL